jgi:hypothetical protein
VYSYNEQTKQVEIEAMGNCMFCDECKAKADSFKKHDLVTITTKPDRFLFTVEVQRLQIISNQIKRNRFQSNVFFSLLQTTGALRPEETLRASFDVLREKLTDLKRHIEIESQIQARPGE